jgi:hypothetical protein
VSEVVEIRKLVGTVTKGSKSLPLFLWFQHLMPSVHLEKPSSRRINEPDDRDDISQQEGHDDRATVTVIYQAGKMGVRGLSLKRVKYDCILRLLNHDNHLETW